jgi:hypothetical protein
MSTEARVTLTTILDIAEAAIRDAQAFEHEHELTTHGTRKLPGNALHAIHVWRRHMTTASHADTVSDTEATAPNTGSQAGEVVSSSSAKELPTVAIAPATSIRIPEPLRERVDQYAHDRRWSFGEATRVALEQLVGYDQDDQPTDRRTAA